MGELVDWALLLETAPAEAARAKLHQSQQLTQETARKVRGNALWGSVRARDELRRRWAPVDPQPNLDDLLAKTNVFAGDGPPPDPIPANMVPGAWYYDRLTNLLYRLEPHT